MNTQLRKVVPCAIPCLFLVVPCLALESAKPRLSLRCAFNVKIELPTGNFASRPIPETAVIFFL
jgi:hypothetical protein